MKVSVVLCTYSMDMYNHFREAAESILSQTYNNIELVVVVDGNKEVFNNVKKDFGDKENVLFHLNNENLGLLESRNKGAKIATGDIIAFIDDDAIADPYWIKKLVKTYKNTDAVAVGGKMTPEWVAGKPEFLPEEFYWLIGVTYKGFPTKQKEVRNTFGSNISFKKPIFQELDGFTTEIVGRKGDKNLQGGETELCARIQQKYNKGVMYNPKAKVAHKIFEYRTKKKWLIDRAFWQGYSKRAMEKIVSNSGNEENKFLKKLLFNYIFQRIKNLFKNPSRSGIKQLLMIYILTGTVGLGYLYGIIKWYKM